jgi:hypothetical protein
MGMKCGIIRDLLPNYIEELTGEDSNIEIKKHLADCEACRQYYQEMCGNIESDIQIFDEPKAEQQKAEQKKELDVLKSFRRMRRRIILAVCILIAGVLSATYLLGWNYYPISYDKANVQVQVVVPEDATENADGFSASGVIVSSMSGGEKTYYTQFVDTTITVNGTQKHIVCVSNKNTIWWQWRFGGVYENDDMGTMSCYGNGYLTDGTPVSEIKEVYYLDRGINKVKRTTDNDTIQNIIDTYGHLVWEK